MIALLVMTDGRQDCIARTIPAALDHLDGELVRKVIHDDSGDPHYQHWLRTTFEPLGFEIARTPGRAGFGGAIRNAWHYLNTTAEVDQARYLFHLEDDFVLYRPVDLAAMIRVLATSEHLVQLALRRQPWNDAERAAGGIVEQYPDDYLDVRARGFEWLEHRRFFTTNPSLYRRSLCWSDWPTGSDSEGVFTHRLLEDPLVRFGFWGARDSGEWCDHIGAERAGTGY